MRKKIDISPTFPPLFDDGELQIVCDYKQKYDTISDILDRNSKVLDAVHQDLKDLGSDDGRGSTYSSEHLLRALLVKWNEGLGFRETVVRIADSTVLRNFTRLNSGKVMNYSLLDTAFKIIRPETWDRINALLEQWARGEKKINGTRLRLDSTVCESNIHYPTDASLLWDCYRVASRMIERIREQESVLGEGYRFHVTKIKKLYTFIATHCTKKNKSTIREVKKSTGILLQRVEAVVETAKSVVEYGKKVACGFKAMVLVNELESYLPDMGKVVAQARRAFNGETVPARERIFSIFETHTELLMRGKQHKPVEFGHLVQIGQTEEKFISFYAVEQKSRHDSEMVDPVLQDHKKSFGAYPSEFSADKNYYKSMEDAKDWEEDIDIFSICKKGKRTPEEIAREHGLLFKLAQKFRAGCGGVDFGLKTCVWAPSVPKSRI